MRKVIAIDLGTVNTLVFIPRQGIIFNEPTCIAINEKSNHTYLVGYEASKLIGRAPQGIKIISPIQNSVIADLSATCKFINAIFRLSKAKSSLNHATLILTVPSDLTPVQRDVFLSLGKKLGVKKVILENKAKLAAIGADVDINSPKGSMIVDIGGGTTDVVVLTIGEIVVSKAINFGGLSIDEDIIRYMRVQHHLKIGEKNAEYIKMKIGSVAEKPENRLLQVSGVNIETSLPHSVIVSTSAISQIIKPTIEHIVDCIRDILFITPPELAADIVENGIAITGGLALLSGIRECLEKSLNVPVRITSDPLSSTIEGCRIGYKDIVKRN